MNSELVRGSHPPGRGSQLTPAERAEIQHLSLVEGLSRSEIARRVRRDRETVRNVLAADDTRHLAEQLATEARDEVLLTLRRNASRVAQDWIEASAVAKSRGDHRPARDLLLHARAIDPIASERDSAPRVAVIIGMPGRPVDLPDIRAFTEQHASSEDDEDSQ